MMKTGGGLVGKRYGSGGWIPMRERLKEFGSHAATVDQVCMCIIIYWLNGKLVSKAVPNKCWISWET